MQASDRRRRTGVLELFAVFGDQLFHLVAMLHVRPLRLRLHVLYDHTTQHRRRHGHGPLYTPITRTGRFPIRPNLGVE